MGALILLVLLGIVVAHFAGISNLWAVFGGLIAFFVVRAYNQFIASDPDEPTSVCG